MTGINSLVYTRQAARCSSILLKMIQKLALFQKTYDFVVWLYYLLNRLPRGHRPILGSHIHNLALSILINIIQANKKLPGEERTQLQEEISIDLDSLRILLRLVKDLKLMSIKQYVYAIEKHNEIARMHKSWINSV